MGQKTWFIAGASSGFGLEIARQVLAKGDKVIGTVRNTVKIQPLLTQYPDNFFYKVMDVTDIPRVQQVVKKVFETQGKIDVIVSNAGYGIYGAAEEISYEEAKHAIDTNLMGSLALSQIIEELAVRLENYKLQTELAAYTDI